PARCLAARRSESAAVALRHEGAARPGECRADSACQMAEGARRRFHAQLALSLTGIAGPTGATEQKPVGLVYYALSTPREALVRDVNVSNRPREGVQLYAAWCA
ncbi:MAG: CinA family protein, partial [Deltaproteobacteria bacterium]